jgi:glycosyltransferase involved in cell wall biosynthesis
MYNKKIKIAFLGSPIVGGNYTHYQYLKEGLNDFDWTLLNAGKINASTLQDDSFVHIASHSDRKKDLHLIANMLLEYIEKEQFDIIIPMNSSIIISLIPFLDSKIKIVQIVNSDTPRVYQSVTAHIDYLDKIICISSKQIQEIKKRVDPEFFNQKTILIPHGVKIQNTEFRQNLTEPLRIGFLGRMHQVHKNILLIPEILKKLKIEFNFELVGEGENKAEFIAGLEKYKITYKDYGIVERQDIDQIISLWDIQLFPSTTEGFGLTLIECMQHGVVPIANHLKGITDFVISHEKDGFIVSKNKIETYVEIINNLNNNRLLLNQIKKEASITVQNRFNLDEILVQYSTVFTQVNDSKKNTKTLEFKNWKPYIEYKPNVIQRILNRF